MTTKIETYTSSLRTSESVCLNKYGKWESTRHYVSFNGYLRSETSFSKISFSIALKDITRNTFLSEGVYDRDGDYHRGGEVKNSTNEIAYAQNISGFHIDGIGIYEESKLLSILDKWEITEADLISAAFSSLSNEDKFKAGFDVEVEQIVNCTPHPIILLSEDEKVILSLPKGEIVPRLSSSTQKVGTIAGVTITRTTFGDVEDLPQAREGTFYIVSRMILSACPQRTDLLVPNELVRDQTGHIIGCKSLANN